MQAAKTVCGPAFRDIPVDIMRGLAITLMIGANLVPFFLEPPVPFWLRLIASLAAPLFIFLSGMMVPLSCQAKHRDLSYFLMKGALTVLIAGVLDLFVWGYFPFMNFDVLYLIGFSLPLVYLCLSLPLTARIGIILGILVASPFLQAITGYSGFVFDIPALSVLTGAQLPPLTAILGQWLVGGWFPVFPWLAVALLGAEAGSFRWQGNTIISFAHREFMLRAGSVFLFGAVLWYLVPGPCLIREGYAELFYPPTMEFLFFITGAIFCLFILADSLPFTSPVFDPLRAMGECSLAVYIGHMIIIAWIIAPRDVLVPLPLFLAGYLVFLACMILMAYGFRYLRRNIRNPPLIVRMVMGG